MEQFSGLLQSKRTLVESQLCLYVFLFSDFKWWVKAENVRILNY